MGPTGPTGPSGGGGPIGVTGATLTYRTTGSGAYTGDGIV